MVEFGSVLEGQHFKTFGGLVDEFLALGIEYLQEVLLEKGFLGALLDDKHISYEERILLDLDPDVVAKLATPNEATICEESLVDVLSFKVELNLAVLLASVQMLLYSYSPLMNLLNQVDRNFPEPRHVCEHAADGPDGLLHRVIDIYNCIALHFDPVDRSDILLGLQDVLFGEER